MSGMRDIGGVVVACRGGEVYAGTAIAFVDVESEEAGSAWGQAHDIRDDQNTAFFLIEFDLPGKVRSFDSAADIGHGAGSALRSIHLLTSY